MDDQTPSSLVRGKILQFAWQDGPTRGKTHEHEFHEDGTVEWHAVGDPPASSGDGGSTDRPHYAAIEVAPDTCLVSYLSKSGYTLTVVLGFRDYSIRGIASNDNTWMQVSGQFNVAEA